ncbi:hypothetical protein LDENG_00030030 [Lucifuga dentata]|nr:hypothetical protein LDENG_00030030 [Lucifuga dentata]
MCNPPACSGSAPGSPPSWTCLKNLQREASRRHLNQMAEPPKLPPFNEKEQRFYFEPLPDVCAPHPIPQGNYLFIYWYLRVLYSYRNRFSVSTSPLPLLILKSPARWELSIMTSSRLMKRCFTVKCYSAGLSLNLNVNL